MKEREGYDRDEERLSEEPQQPRERLVRIVVDMRTRRTSFRSYSGVSGKRASATETEEC